MRYGGAGEVAVESKTGWKLPAEAAVVLRPRPVRLTILETMKLKPLRETTQPRVMPWGPEQPSTESLLTREWLVTNGLGGFGSGTISGAVTRRYHGLLVAALPAPLGRCVMWSHVSEVLRFGENDLVPLGGEERAGGQLDLHGAQHFKEFRLEKGLPVWIFAVRGLTIEKRIIMPHRQNTVHLTYRVSGSGTLPRLEVRPAFHFRHYADRVDALPEATYEIRATDGRYEVFDAAKRFPPLRMRLSECDCDLLIEPRKIHEIVYRTELDRGYDYEGDLWSPGIFRITLRESGTATLIGSTEEWHIIDVLTPERGAKIGANSAYAIARTGASGGAGQRRGGIGPGSGPICHHTRRSCGGRSKSARRRRRSAHGHRRLSLVH